MTIIIELDSIYAGFGIDWLDNIKGFRLGYLAIHFISMSYTEFVAIENKQEG